MSVLKTYTVEGTCPSLYVDEKADIRIDCTIHFRSKCVLKLASEGTAPETAVCNTIQMAVQIAYIRSFDAGIPAEVMEAGHPDADFSAAIAKRLSTEVKLLYGAELEEFTVEEHHIAAEDEAKLAKQREMKRLTDPRIAAEELRKTLEQAVEAAAARTAEGAAAAEVTNEWICECGKSNRSRFCPDCGKPRSYARWLCACGAVNTGKFCTECGKRLVAPAGEA